MKLQGDFVFDAPLEQVWAALLDPEVLAAAMPGCDRLDRVDGQYRGELNVKVGPVQGKFTGKVDLRDIDPPNGYTMIVDGQGAPGFVKASAVVKLEHAGEGTRMRYDADAQVGGKIASVGQRLLEASARAITKQSLEGLRENIKIRAAKSSVVNDPPAAVTEPGARAAAQPLAPAGPAAADAGGASPPAVVLKRVSQTKLAANIAQEVTKSLLPTPLLISIVIAVALIAGWLFLRR